MQSNILKNSLAFTLLIILLSPANCLAQAQGNSCATFYKQNLRTYLNDGLSESAYQKEINKLCEKFNSTDFSNTESEKEFTASARASYKVIAKARGNTKDSEKMTATELKEFASLSCKESFSESEFNKITSTLKDFIPIEFANAFNECIRLSKTYLESNIQYSYDQYGAPTKAVVTLKDLHPDDRNKSYIYSVSASPSENFTLSGDIGRWWMSKKNKSKGLKLRRPMELIIERNSTNEIYFDDVVTIPYSLDVVVVQFKRVFTPNNLEHLSPQLLISGKDVHGGGIKWNTSYKSEKQYIRLGKTPYPLGITMHTPYEGEASGKFRISDNMRYFNGVFGVSHGDRMSSAKIEFGAATGTGYIFVDNKCVYKMEVKGAEFDMFSVPIPEGAKQIELRTSNENAVGKLKNNGTHTAWGNACYSSSLPLYKVIESGGCN